MALRIISSERTFNNLARAHQSFLCLFCARFALLKTRLSNRNSIQKGLKIELFLQKMQKLFCVFFSETPHPESRILTPHLCPPPFENFLLDVLNSEPKLSVKKPVDRAGQKLVDWPVNQRWFWILPVGSGRVEKILTGSIFDPSHLEISTQKCKCSNVFWTWPVSKWRAEEQRNLNPQLVSKS